MKFDFQNTVFIVISENIKNFPLYGTYTHSKASITETQLQIIMHATHFKLLNEYNVFSQPSWKQ